MRKNTLHILVNGLTATSFDLFSDSVAISLRIIALKLSSSLPARTTCAISWEKADLPFL